VRWVTRHSVSVAWALVAMASMCIAASVPLLVGRTPFHEDPASLLGSYVTLLLVYGFFLPVGAVIVAHRPRHPVGWLYVGAGLLAATGVLSQEYAAYAHFHRGGQMPAAFMATVYQAWWWYPASILPFVLAPLVFPTGRLPSPRWRPFLIATIVLLIVYSVLAVFAPAIRLEETDIRIANPIGIAGLPDPESALLTAPALVCIVIAALSLVQRFRRSRGIQRQQIKWFSYAVALLAVGFVTLVYGVPPRGVFDTDAFPDWVWSLVVVPVPLATAIAILRHGLFDIDRLINRTLVYAGVSAFLVAVYAILVLSVAVVLGRVGEDTPVWAVAAATLTVAALFQPARRSIQALVDRRFYRQRYDAARAVAAFSARLRERVHLESFSSELLDVTARTMQPTAVSLWLRDDLSVRDLAVPDDHGG
jgi:hypothetical protein